MQIDERDRIARLKSRIRKWARRAVPVAAHVPVAACKRDLVTVGSQLSGVAVAA